MIELKNRLSTNFPRPLHLPPRCTQPGGYIINVMRDENRRKVAIYDGVYDAQCQKLVDELKWERIYEHVNPNYYGNSQKKLHGLVHVFRKKEKLTKDEAFRRIMQVKEGGKEEGDGRMNE